MLPNIAGLDFPILSQQEKHNPPVSKTFLTSPSHKGDALHSPLARY